MTFSIVWVERLLKLRKCEVKDVMFNIGWLGMILAGIESIIYLFINAGTINKPVIIQYIAAVFGTAPDFFLALLRLLGAGVMILLCFVIMKYSSSLRMWAYCGFFQSFAYMVVFCRLGWYTGTYAGFGCWECFGYALVFLNASCGEHYLAENQEKNPASGGVLIAA